MTYPPDPFPKREGGDGTFRGVSRSGQIRAAVRNHYLRGNPSNFSCLTIYFS